MMQVVCELGIELADARMDLLAAVDQMSGPQTILPQMVQFQRADTPERLDRLVARLEAYGPFMDAYVGLLAEGRASGLAAPRIAVDRTIAQTERLLAIPADESPIVQSASSRTGTRTPCAARRAVEAHVRPCPRALPRGARRRLPGRRPRRPRALVRPERRRAVPAGRSLVDDAGADRPRFTRSAWTSSRRSTRSAAPSRARPGSEVTSTHIVATSRPIRRTSPRPATRSWHGRARHRASARGGAGLVRRLPGRGLRYPARRRVHGEGRAVRVLLPAGDRRIAARDLLREHVRPRASLPLEPRHDDLPRGRARPPFPDRARDGAPGPAGLPAPRLAARGRAYAEGWGLYSERLADEMGLFRDEGERFGMLTAQAWRAARLIVDTGIHALRRTPLGRPDAVGRGTTETDASIETGSLHHVARPGAHLQDRPARDRAAAPRADGPRRVRVRRPCLPRRGPWSRLAAPRDAPRGAPDLADRPCEVGERRGSFRAAGEPGTAQATGTRRPD